MTLEAALKVIETSMLKTTNFYAKEGNMIAATAIHDAFLGVKKALKQEFGNETKT
jgi:hypothetical protein